MASRLEDVMVQALTREASPTKGGRRSTGRPAALALIVAALVLEVGPYVVPHSAYTFPPAL